jgi:hypothetical protein
MSEPINQIRHIVGSVNYQTFQNSLRTHSGFGEGKGTKQTSSKFIVEDNTIVYEKYDHHGKLISKVPWSQKTLVKKVVI